MCEGYVCVCVSDFVRARVCVSVCVLPHAERTLHVYTV